MATRGSPVVVFHARSAETPETIGSPGPWTAVSRVEAGAKLKRLYCSS